MKENFFVNFILKQNFFVYTRVQVHKHYRYGFDQ